MSNFPINELMNFILDLEEVEPEKIGEIEGYAFGFPMDSLPEVIIKYLLYKDNGDFDKAENLFEHLKLSLKIEELSKWHNNSLRNYFGLSRNQNLKEYKVELYSEFSEKPKKEIMRIINKRSKLKVEKWNNIIEDEEKITPLELKEYYNSLPFPMDISSLPTHTNNLGKAYRMLAPLVINNLSNINNIFDFGGNVGRELMLIESNCEVENFLLIEEGETLLDYAQWRDEKFDFDNVNYIQTNELKNQLLQYEDGFDFGICYEVLEHLFDVEEAIEIMAKLLRKGGVLYQSTSFGLYPHPSHLKENTKYDGKEDELMAKFGFEKLEIEGLPLPLVLKKRFYRKT